MHKGIVRFSVPILLGLLLSGVAFAHHEVIKSTAERYTMIALHVAELVLAIFICFMALRFFAITKPINMFLIIYIAGGFFIIGSLIHLLPYVLALFGIHMNFISVHFGGRVALIGMLISLGATFYYINSQMRKMQ